MAVPQAVQLNCVTAIPAEQLGHLCGITFLATMSKSISNYWSLVKYFDISQNNLGVSKFFWFEAPI
jgi:hypothetical protein